MFTVILDFFKVWFLKCEAFAFSMNLILYTSLGNAFSQQEEEEGRMISDQVV